MINVNEGRVKATNGEAIRRDLIEMTRKDGGMMIKGVGMGLHF